MSAEAASQHGQLISSLGGLFFDVPLEESAHLPPTPPSTLNSSYSPPPTPVLESSDPFSPDEVDFYSALPPAFTAEDLPAEFSTEEGPRSPVELLNLSDMSARNTRNRHYQLHERFGYMPTIDEVLTGNAPSNDQPRARIRFREPWPPIHCITELNPMSPAETSDANADDLEEMGEAQPEPISDEEVVEETATTATFVRAMGSSMVDGTSDTQPTNAAVHKAVLVEVRPGRHIRPNPVSNSSYTQSGILINGRKIILSLPRLPIPLKSSVIFRLRLILSRNSLLCKSSTLSPPRPSMLMKTRLQV